MSRRGGEAKRRMSQVDEVGVLRRGGVGSLGWVLCLAGCYELHGTSNVPDGGLTDIMRTPT